jgi:hypothetical protein
MRYFKSRTVSSTALEELLDANLRRSERSLLCIILAGITLIAAVISFAFISDPRSPEADIAAYVFVGANFVLFIAGTLFAIYRIKVRDLRSRISSQIEKDKLSKKPQDSVSGELSDVDEPDEWLTSRVRPTPQPYGVSDQGAEHLVAEWLHYLGFEDAQVTQYSGDGGIDVETYEHVVQVKNYRDKAVSVTEVRELFGVAASERKKAVLFTSSSCTTQAIEFADKNGIALIKFDSRQASLEEINDDGSDFLVNGEYEEG